jgi:hypothetical protein
MPIIARGYTYIYIVLININVNKRETLIKQIGYSQVSYKIYRKKYLPVGKLSQILPFSELFVFTITAFKISSIFIMIVHYEPSLWKEYYPHAKYNPVCIEWHKCTLKGQIVCIKYRWRPVHDISLRKRSKMFVVTMQLQFNRDLNSDLR